MNKLENILHAPVNFAGWLALKVMSAEPHSDTWTKIVGYGLIPAVIGLTIWIGFWE